MKEITLGGNNIFILQIHTESFYTPVGYCASPAHWYVYQNPIGRRKPNGLKNIQVFLIVNVGAGAFNLANNSNPKT